MLQLQLNHRVTRCRGQPLNTSKHVPSEGRNINFNNAHWWNGPNNVIYCLWKKRCFNNTFLTNKSYLLQSIAIANKSRQMHFFNFGLLRFNLGTGTQDLTIDAVVFHCCNDIPFKYVVKGTECTYFCANTCTL